MSVLRVVLICGGNAFLFKNNRWISGVDRSIGNDGERYCCGCSNIIRQCLLTQYTESIPQHDIHTCAWQVYDYMYERVPSTACEPRKSSVPHSGLESMYEYIYIYILPGIYIYIYICVKMRFLDSFCDFLFRKLPEVVR